MQSSAQGNPFEFDPEPGERAFARVAEGLADAIHALLPSCAAGIVVIESGGEWRLLAQRGPIDLSPTWRERVARHVRAGDRASDDGGCLVAPFSAVALRVMLVLVPVADAPGLPRLQTIVQPLLDAGGILLDRSLSTTRLDLPYHRTIEEELRVAHPLPAPLSRSSTPAAQPIHRGRSKVA